MVGTLDAVPHDGTTIDDLMKLVERVEADAATREMLDDYEALSDRYPQFDTIETFRPEESAHA
ncbi:hypothetical protein Acid345_3380 [Candidatus Koribacter versatilis Ellin345]|uniref:Uncharacterized protein n=1 Tax=Koribacter versatilis (strain Ellin345) TaxID=204669 RepID=Q1IL69_KORVE|nr:hypothetical protein [Candidatus Koribacter versatilis]ABF42381.1 hypothetical protein Acid345_3380 [Candidatus Koribacter versatilis Ellin345]